MKAFSIPNVYTISAIGYILANSSNMGTTMTRLFMFPFYVLSIYYVYKCIKVCRLNKYMKILTAFLSIALIYGLVLLVFPPVHGWIVQGSGTTFLTMYISSIAPIYAFYYFGQKHLLSEKWFKITFFVFVAAASIEYINTRDAVLIARNLNLDEEITNNAGYVWVSLLPCMAFFKKPIIRYVGIAFITMMVLMCAKRGAIVVAGLVDLYFVFSTLKKSRGVKRIGVIVVITAITLILVDNFTLLLSNADYLTLRLSDTLEGDSNGRDGLTDLFIYYIINKSTLINMLFGHGAMGSMHYLGRMAHNDWLQIFFDMGILGLIIYLIYWFTFMKTYNSYRKVRNMEEPTMLAMGAFGIIYFVSSFYSMSIFEMSFYATSLLGYSMFIYNETTHPVSECIMTETRPNSIKRNQN